MRLDTELVRRKIFKTRTKAKEAIISKIIYCNKKLVDKPSFEIHNNDLIEIKGEIMPYVSKGGLKLEKALKTFTINLNKKVMLDIGSSTGGFTECALNYGVNKIIAVDVGTNQLDYSLRDNKKIELYEQTDIREIDLNIINNVDIATIDISFISVIKILQKLKEIDSLKEIICLIKPQFECGKQIANKYKGVINNKQIHCDILNNVLGSFKEIDFYCSGLTFSPLTGGDGNREYLGYFTKNTQSKINNIETIVKECFDFT